MPVLTVAKQPSCPLLYAGGVAQRIQVRQPLTVMTLNNISRAYLGVLPTARAAGRTAQEAAHSPRHSLAVVLPSCQVAEGDPNCQAEVRLPIHPANMVDEQASPSEIAIKCELNKGCCVLQ